MLTPIEIQDKSFKSGIGYDKKDVDAFLRDILKNYELLYTKNAELEDKVTVLSEGIAHYKSNEKSIQKALVLAQSVADEIIATANKKAQAIEEKAYAKSDEILLNSKTELNRLNTKISDLTLKFENYRNSCKHFALAQIEMLDNNILTSTIPATPVNNTVTEVSTNTIHEVNKETEVKTAPVCEDFSVNIDFNDFDNKTQSPQTSPIQEVEVKEEPKTILSFDNTFTEVKATDEKPVLADEFNIGITFSENTKFNPDDSIRYYEEQISEKEDNIVKEAGINVEEDEFTFDDMDDDTNSIGIDFDFLNTRK